MKPAELLSAELSRPRYQPSTLALGTVTDAYQPAERRLRITRGVIEVLSETRHPFSIITKSGLVERDKVRAMLGKVVSPAMGGVIIGHEMGRALGLDALFVERPTGRIEEA